MKQRVWAFTALALSAVPVGSAVAQQVAPIADFELNGSTANTGTTGSLTNNGAVFGSYGGASGLLFAANQGPTVNGIGALAAYTIDLAFNFTDQGRYFKIIDMSALASDAGIYSYFNQLSLYPNATTTAAVFTPGTNTRLTLARSTAGIVSGYVNGVSVITYDDSSTLNFVFAGGPLSFFQDDAATGRGEADAGFVDYIRIYNAALTPAQAGLPTGGTGAVPEPAVWAMMLAGFGAVGVAMRRRRTPAMAVAPAA